MVHIDDESPNTDGLTIADFVEDTAKHSGLTLGFARVFEEEAVDNALLERPWWYVEKGWFPVRFIPE